MISLSNVLKANAISCIGFGLTFLLFPELVGSFLSENNQAPSFVLTVLGIGLFINGLHLLWVSFKSLPSKFIVLYFSIGDYIWVFATSYLLIAGLWITTPLGIAITILVSAVVGTFGLLQMTKRKKIDHC